VLGFGFVFAIGWLWCNFASLVTGNMCREFVWLGWVSSFALFASLSGLVSGYLGKDDSASPVGISLGTVSDVAGVFSRIRGVVCSVSVWAPYYSSTVRVDHRCVLFGPC
jgi:hypothetical protein